MLLSVDLIKHIEYIQFDISDNRGEKIFLFVIDYRRQNQIKIDGKYHVPNIDGILNKLGKPQYFSTIDLAKGYH